MLHDPAAFAQLLQYLTVPVSEMFRDPAYFLALRRHVVPVLRTYPSLKVWVAGCSTGEEAYSLAILLHEEGLLERTILYATDINHGLAGEGAAGIFDARAHAGLHAQLPARRRHRAASRDYYTAAYGGALFDQRLRDAITFADHSLATDSVFAETHLVSCRNVLIYFNRALQDRALGLFHDSLAHRGFLGLGLQGDAGLLRAMPSASRRVSRPDRLYRKLPGRGMKTRAAARLRRSPPRPSRSAPRPAASTRCSRCSSTCRAGMRAAHRDRAAPARATTRAGWSQVFASRLQVPVQEAQPHAPVAPGTVYFAPPGYHLLVEARPQLLAELRAAGAVLAARRSTCCWNRCADAYGAGAGRHRADRRQRGRRPRPGRASSAAAA